MIVLLAITAYPLIYNIWNSFQHDVINSGLPPTFAGTANYSRIFTDNQFLPALAHTAGFTVVSVVVETVVGLAIALVLNRKFPAGAWCARLSSSRGPCRPWCPHSCGSRCSTRRTGESTMC